MIKSEAHVEQMLDLDLKFRFDTFTLKEGIYIHTHMPIPLDPNVNSPKVVGRIR